MQMRRRPLSGDDRAGFTLVEVLLAVAIASMAMLAVTTSFVSTIRARDKIRVLAQSTEDGERILSLLESDLRGLWIYNIEKNKVFLGQNRDLAGYSSDRLNFLTATEAFVPIQNNTGTYVRPPVCEVGYWLRENDRLPGKLELWRREDPMVDDDLTTGGTFQLVCDRIESFNIEYFETLGYEAEPRFEWDSSIDYKLPRRIRVEFTVERRLGNRNRVNDAEIDDFEKINKKYVRDFVLDRRMVDILQPQIGMIPIAPSGPPASQDGPIGPAGPGGPTGQGAFTGGPGDQGFPAGGERVISDTGSTRTTAGPGGTRGGARPPAGGGGQVPINLGDLLRGGGGGGGGGGLGGLFGGGG